MPKVIRVTTTNTITFPFDRDNYPPELHITTIEEAAEEEQACIEKEQSYLYSDYPDGTVVSAEVVVDVVDVEEPNPNQGELNLKDI